MKSLYLVPVLALIALMAWALASPMGASPDDDYHLVSIWCAGTNTSECEPGISESSRLAPEALVESAQCYAHKPDVSAACQAKTFDLDPTPSTLTERGNFVGAYPPVYYATMNVFAGPNILGSIVVMRLVNVVLFVGLTTLLYALLGPLRRPTLVWGWLISTVPLGLFILSSNNPSAWAIIGVGTSWLALLGYFEARGRRRIGLAAVFVLATLMAAGSRGDSAVYACLGIIVVMTLVARIERGFLLRSILPILMVVVAAVFFLTSQQTQTGLEGFTAPAGSVPATGPVPDKPSGLAAIGSLLMNVPSLWAGVFGYQGYAGAWGLGWLDTTMPTLVSFGAIACFAGVAFVGLRSMSTRKALALAGVVMVLLLLPTWVLFRGGNSVGEQVQPRYLLPLIVLLAGLAVLNVGSRLVRLSTTQRLVVVATLSVVQAVALYVNMRRYVQGNHGGWNLDNGPLWWWDVPFSPMFVVIIGSAAFAAMVWILVRESGRPETADPVGSATYRAVA